MLYFAYGSNMSLKQMSCRCPNSIFVGRAVLHDYRWQINGRGYANIVHCPRGVNSNGASSNAEINAIIRDPHDPVRDGDSTNADTNADTNTDTGTCVHGLVYWLDVKNCDEARLDICEGVSTGAYSKEYLDMDFYPAPPHLHVLAGRVKEVMDEPSGRVSPR